MIAVAPHVVDPAGKVEALDGFAIDAGQFAMACFAVLKSSTLRRIVVD